MIEKFLNSKLDLSTVSTAGDELPAVVRFGRKRKVRNFNSTFFLKSVSTLSLSVGCYVVAAKKLRIEFYNGLASGS